MSMHRHASVTALVGAAAVLSSVPAQLQSLTPGPRIGHSLVYYEPDQQIVLLDGYSWNRAIAHVDPPALTEVWSWNGATWKIGPGAGPASRAMGRAVYDGARKAIISYGGRVGRNEQSSSETWAWGLAGWSRLPDIPAGPNVHIEMAYDAARGTTIRFGGATPEAGGRFKWPSDTWQLQDSRWNRVATQGPPGRAAFAMVYDSARREVVLFGGQGAATGQGQPPVLFGDTWIWDGNTWRLASSNGPSARAFHAMAFDRRRNVVILYGGNHRDVIFDDMWTWDGTRWTAVDQGRVTPGQRRMHAMAYDAGRDTTVLFGGAGPRPAGGTIVHDDTWEWDGRRWIRAQ